MARTKKAAAPTQAVVEATPDAGPAETPVTEEITAGDANGTHTARLAADQGPRAREGIEQPVYAADPNEKIRVSLNDVRGGPSMQLLRSHRYNQMQVRFEGQQPDEQFLAMLKEKGWRDRTEEEGVWTKQIDRDRKWQSVAKMEEEFKEVANAIRKDKGLGPVLEVGA